METPKKERRLYIYKECKDVYQVQERHNGKQQPIAIIGSTNHPEETTLMYMRKNFAGSKIKFIL